MSGKAPKKVDLPRLAAALPDFPFAYLITVDDDYRAHTVAVEPVLRDGEVLVVGLIGGGTRTNVQRRSDVTLLWPPTQPGGYSLIVDGRATLSDAAGAAGSDAGEVAGATLSNAAGAAGSNAADAALCAVVPTRALLHRNADASSAANGCLHDCVVFALPG